MATDLDHDDAIGQRLRELREPSVSTAPGAWDGVEQRRRKHRTRRIVTVGAVVVVLVVAAGGFVAAVNRGDRKRVEIVSPVPRIDAPKPAGEAPILEVLARAKRGLLTVALSGQSTNDVRVSLGSADFQDEADANAIVSICYPWADGETCDPAITSAPTAQRGTESGAWNMTLPGWVHTPTGLQSCGEIECRVVVDDSVGHRYASDRISIDAGPKPEPLAQLGPIDGNRLTITTPGLEPDPSWTAWAATVDAPRGVLQPGTISVCAWTIPLRCDLVNTLQPPRFDGKPETLTVRTNAKLPTWRERVDCAAVTCAVVISRTIGVAPQAGGVGASDMPIAVLPFRLALDMADSPDPELVVVPVDLRPGVAASIALRNPPFGDAKTWLPVVCTSSNAAEIAGGEVCSEPGDASPVPRRDDTIEYHFTVPACREPAGCYLAVRPQQIGSQPIAVTKERVVPQSR